MRVKAGTREKHLTARLQTAEAKLTALRQIKAALADYQLAAEDGAAAIAAIDRAAEIETLNGLLANARGDIDALRKQNDILLEAFLPANLLTYMQDTKAHLNLRAEGTQFAAWLVLSSGNIVKERSPESFRDAISRLTDVVSYLVEK